MVNQCNGYDSHVDTDSVLDNAADLFAELAKRKKPKVLVIMANPFGFGAKVENRTNIVLLIYLLGKAYGKIG